MRVNINITLVVSVDNIHIITHVSFNIILNTTIYVFSSRHTDPALPLQ